MMLLESHKKLLNRGTGCTQLNSRLQFAKAFNDLVHNEKEQLQPIGLNTVLV